MNFIYSPHGCDLQAASDSSEKTQTQSDEGVTAATLSRHAAVAKPLPLLTIFFSLFERVDS